MTHTTSAALSDRAAELLERMVSEEEARARQRLRERPIRLHAELDRRYHEALAQNVVSRSVVQRTEDGDALLTEDCGARRITVSNAGRIAAEVNTARAFLSEASDLARLAHRLRPDELTTRCHQLAARAQVNLD